MPTSPRPSSADDLVSTGNKQELRLPGLLAGATAVVALFAMLALALHAVTPHIAAHGPNYNVWLAPFAVVTLVLAHRSLSVPALRAEARVDPKTGLFNARHFATTLRQELDRAVRFGRPMSVIMADLDLLRDINNTYGHLAGDAILAGVADVFRRELRDYDVAARFGGEEFSLILPATSMEGARLVADLICTSVYQLGIPNRGAPLERVTVSIGGATCSLSQVESHETLLEAADLALYEAKRMGKNQAVLRELG